MTKALDRLVQRHEALAMTISADGASLCIGRVSVQEVPVLDLRETSAESREQELQSLLRKEVEEPFVLERGPLIRFHYVRLAEAEQMLVITAHHIICDGLSWGVILPDLAELYRAELQQTPAELPEADRYSDYARYLAGEEHQAVFNAAEQYWLGKYADAVPQLELPTDFTRPAIKTYAADRLDYRVDPQRVAGLKKLASDQGATFVITLMAAFNTYLARLSGQSDIALGLMAAGQSAAGFRNLVGHCVNVLPVRSSLDGEQSFATYLKAFRSDLFDAFEHQQFSFSSLLKKLPIARDPARVPLLPVTFNVDQEIGGLEFPDLRVEVISNKRRFENFELFLNAVEMADNGLILECSYNSDLFSAATIADRMAGFEALIESVISNPEQALQEISIVSEAEKQRLESWNQTRQPFSNEAPVYQLIDAQAEQTPDKTALVCDGQTLTYRQLSESSNRLAHFLQGQQAFCAEPVAIALSRSVELMVAMLGILKAGAAYLPLDPSYPRERIDYILQHSGVKLIVCDNKLVNKFPQNSSCVALDSPKVQEEITAAPAKLPVNTICADSLAYVIYTSGSTGQPKGVEITHRNVVNFLQTMARTPGIMADDALLAVTTVSFDIAVLELFLPLVVGARTVIATRETASDAHLLAQSIENHDITVMQATPATWRMLLESDWQGSQSLKGLCGGEALPLALARKLVHKVASLWNMYGPTETTIWSSCARITPGDQLISIGKPIANTRFYVLDSQLQPTPIGVSGELYIAGEGVARGYAKSPELTAERFIMRDGERLYRTGDLARFLPNGDVEHLGRSDTQIKLRGFRIELGEVENTLAKHPSVDSVVAEVREVQPQDKRLVAYIIPTSSSKVDAESLRLHCQQHIPDYMIPQYFVELQEFPLTPNNKIDRKALPDPEAGMQLESAAFSSPQTAMEQEVSKVWCDVLRMEKIDINQNFFMLGGHSLLAVQIVSRLRRELDQNIPVGLLFESPSIRQMAERLEGSSASDYSAPPPIAHQETPAPAPLTQSQKRLLFLQQLYPESAVLNQVGVFRLQGHYDLQAFESALAAIQQRHDILRSHIVWHENAEVLQSFDTRPVKLEVQDLRHEAREVLIDSLLQRVDGMVNDPFQLDQGGLLRVGIALLGEQDCALIVLSHPLIWDGWSFDIFLKEFASLYATEKDGKASDLPELTLQYSDYPAWHRDWLAGGEGERQLGFWKEQLAAASSHIELPRDYERPAVLSFKGGREPLYLSADEVSHLTRVAKQEGTTLYMVLLSVFTALLYRYSHQDDIVVATQVQGRVRPELEGLIGTFVNTVLLRNRFSEDMGFRELLRQVREVCLQAFAHQDVPFEQVMESLPSSGRGEASQAYQVMFTYQDTTNRSSRFADLAISQINPVAHAVYTDLLFWLKETGAGLYGGLDYSADCFKQETIACMLDDFKKGLQDIAKSPDMALEQLHLSIPSMSSSKQSVESEQDAHKTQAESSVPEATSMQQLISRICRDSLGLDEIDPYDNFFELGGDSLRAMQVLAKIRSETGIHVPARAILMDSLAQIASYCEKAQLGGQSAEVEESAPSKQQKPAPLMSRLSRLVSRIKPEKTSLDAKLNKEQQEYEDHFATASAENLFRGVYSRFEEAIQSAPQTKPMGYDHDAPANMYKDRLERIYPSDYPILFWLEKALASHRLNDKGGVCDRVFDLGGHIGVAFYSYRNYIQYPQTIDWQVCDVEAVTRAGLRLAEKRAATQLSFTTYYDEADGRDIYFSSGALQYLEEPFASLIARLSSKPGHLLLNLLPLCDGDGFVTLQNIGTAFCPYRVSNKNEFIASVLALGYELVDQWDNPEKSCNIPFYPEQSLDHYTGMYFRLK
ncbi:unnamed protein product [Cyprideis torosa]|uniref:Fatty acid synthase n=1 Tax=Cyprideis torosa TaxID=163714 RepID=A0A7R8ZGR2_9CRUS|nr:unnamed protein product [Cyprideis torosa]CAG0882008.1 unnamed protein product [Cyprideis torosa]